MGGDGVEKGGLVGESDCGGIGGVDVGEECGVEVGCGGDAVSGGASD